MESVQRTIRIDAPVERLWRYLADPKHLPEFWPSMVEVSNAVVAPDARHSFDWIYKMAGVKFRGHADTLELLSERLRVVRNEGGIPSTFRWIFEPRGATTDLRLEITYELPIPVLGRLASPVVRWMNEREADTMLANLKARMETRAEPRAPAAG
jgi:uncharacterized protein YndB with AHSA1/START domain